MTAYPCPFCASTADLISGCPGCRRGPDPVAAELAGLDEKIVELHARVQATRHEHLVLAEALRTAQLWRNELAAKVAAAVRAERPARPPSRPSAAGPAPSTVVTPEASVRTVQNTLFILGGLLLGTAAIVFTAVAWATFGVTGRAAILAVVTGLALSAPFLALRRRLAATAETFAALGLLLVVLDGYAAWYVNLFGLGEGSVTRYIALVCAVTSVVAAGYGAATGLIGPRFSALLVAQPVLPLFAAHTGLGPAGWAGVGIGLAALNLAVVVSGRGGAAMRACAWALYGTSAGTAATLGFGALVLSGPAPAMARSGVAFAGTGLVLVVGSLVARSARFQEIAAAVLVVQLGAAGARFLTVVYPQWTLVLPAAVAAGLAAAVPLLPGAVRRGPRVGAAVVAGSVAVAVVGLTIAGWLRWLLTGEITFDGQLPAAVVLVTAALAVLVPARARLDTLVTGAAVLVVGLPSAYRLDWPALATVNVVALAAATLGATRARSVQTASVCAGAAAVLVAHAVVVSLGTPAATATVLAALTVIGVAAAVLNRHRSTVDIGAMALAAGLFAWPLAVERGLTAAGVNPWWVTRSALAATALVVPALAAIGRAWPAYRRAALLALVAAAVVAGRPPAADPPGVYAAVGLLLVAAGAALVPGRDWWAPAGALAVLGTPFALDVAPSAWAVFGAPYGWLDAVWSGPPSRGPSAATEDAVALAVLTVAAGLAALGWRRTWRAAVIGGLPTACATVLVALAAWGAPWPAVPATSLLLGLAIGLATAVAPHGHRFAAVGVPLAALLTTTGLAGALPTERTTLAALGLTVVVSATAGAAGRATGARVTGWLVAVAAAVSTAVAAGLAVDLPLRVAAFAVLGAAAVALAVSAGLPARRAVEAVAVESAAHAGAFVALLLTIGSARYAAGVATLWGVAVGLRALSPGQDAAGRRVRASIAAGSELFAWWMLLAAESVALVEAYTLPAAAVALLVGWLALRSRPALSSWVAYGPALAAALLPSLASVLVAEGEPVRRLALGAGALAAVLAGSVWRRQAPVVAGGVVLVLLALHELVLVWDLLPRWIPLATGGLLLVGLAMSYERRRRDVARLRESLGRMS